MISVLPFSLQYVRKEVRLGAQGWEELLRKSARLTQQAPAFGSAVPALRRTDAYMCSVCLSGKIILMWYLT